MTDVVVGDDHGVFVEALSTVLGQRRLVVRAVAHCASEVLAAVAAHRPSVCLLDRFFCDGDGISLIPELLAVSPGTRVIIVTADPDRGAASRALARGARGFVHKTRGVIALLEAIHRVAEGATVVELPPRRPAPDAGEGTWVRHLAAGLTGREWQCLRLIVEGRGTTSEIATDLGVLPTTVRTHVQAVLTKLGVHSRLEAAVVATRHGLLTPT